MDDGAREVLVVRDIATRMIAAIPTESRHTDQVVNAMKRLIGRRKVKMAYSDVAPEFEAAMSELRIQLDHSLPGKPHNSLAERTNQEVFNTVSTALLHAGLPAQYWTYALNCVMHNLNIEDVEGDGDSAWKRMIGGESHTIWGRSVLQTNRYKRQDLWSQVRPERDPTYLCRVHRHDRSELDKEVSRLGHERVCECEPVYGGCGSQEACSALPDRGNTSSQRDHVPIESRVYERMNETLEGLKDSVNLGGKEINDVDWWWWRRRR